MRIYVRETGSGNINTASKQVITEEAIAIAGGTQVATVVEIDRANGLNRADRGIIAYGAAVLDI